MATTLEGTSWLLDSQALGIAGGDEFTPTAGLDDGTIYGSTGCNRYTAIYAKTRSKLTLGPAASTRRTCGPIAAAIEAEYLARLSRVVSYKIKGKTLTLADAAGATVLTFAVSTATLAGSWEITGYLMASGQGFSSTVIDSAPAAIFGPDGALSGSTGGNSFRGTYHVDGATVSIGPLATTRMACPPELADQEAGILAALESATTFTLEPGAVVLLNAAGQRAIALTSS